MKKCPTNLEMNITRKYYESVNFNFRNTGCEK